MKHKTWFRLVLKALGVLFFAFGIVTVIPSIGYLVENISSPGTFAHFWYFQVSSPVLQIAIGLYLFFGGEWVVNKAIPSNRPYCPECGYDLSGAVRDRCPECDSPFDLEKVRPSTLAARRNDGDDNTDDT